VIGEAVTAWTLADALLEKDGGPHGRDKRPFSDPVAGPNPVLNMKHNLILIGYMGSGKSRPAGSGPEVGWRSSTRTKPSRCGRASGCMKSSKPSEARFRSLERDLLGEVLEGEHQVVATGGGMWVDPDNRRRLLENGCVFGSKWGFPKCGNGSRPTGDRPL